jgi:catechol 2,3-dioxygenase-like lactoylglutathione lyase family enzyme
VIDHVYISVSDIKRSRKLYRAILESLGWRGFGEYKAPEHIDTPDLYGFADKHHGSGVKIGSSVWLRESNSGTGVLAGIVAASPEEVDAAYDAAIKAGARDAGTPATREYFGPGYYAANVIDFDENVIEIVNKSWNPKP